MDPREMAKWESMVIRASELRNQLSQVNRDLEREEKRDAIRRIKREAFLLLLETDIPWPLKFLIVDLWGGLQTVDNKWSAEKFAAALMDARQTRRVGNKRMATLLQNETGVAIDPTQIGRWRKDPEYKCFVNVRHDPAQEGDSNSP
jgi:hypothetical protein